MHVTLIDGFMFGKNSLYADNQRLIYVVRSVHNSGKFTRPHQLFLGRAGNKYAKMHILI